MALTGIRFHGVLQESITHYNDGRAIVEMTKSSAPSFWLFGGFAETSVVKYIDKIEVEIPVVIGKDGTREDNPEIFVSYAWEDEDYGYDDASLYLSEVGDWLNWEVA